MDTVRIADNRTRGRRKCYFCQNPAIKITYKDPLRLKRYLTPRGKIVSRFKTRVCSRHQKLLTTAIKKARILAILPFVNREL
ncbi:30S ribosomal protein S18 [bacterium CG1_02_42_9]|nr:MAG: 30S ribosomal protein S18 [bacterium CG1_02_42_9]